MQQMNQVITRAVSYALDTQQAAQELAAQLADPEIGFVLFFCSAEFDLARLSIAIEQSQPEVMVVGCTTAGEITPFGYARGCICALGFSRQLFTVGAALIEEMEQFSLIKAQELVGGLINQCRSSAQAVLPIKDHSFVLTLFDGLASREETVLAALSAALGGIPLFGGSAGDDNYLSQTHVYYQGRFHSGAAIVVLINTPLEFEVFNMHHLTPSAEKLVVTKVDSQLRQVLEVNAEPAVSAYQQLTAAQQLGMDVFACHPLAVKIGENYYPRAIQKANHNQSLTFYCAVDNGIVLTAMQRQSLIDTLNQLFAGINQRLGELLLTIGCDCVLRRLESEITGQHQRVEQILIEQQVVGFNTYGEQINGMHVNQTFTGVAIGKKYKQRRS
ncbi:GfdT protein [Thiopseudomonas alkaliphila]|uniref:nitric oxide-sensing protein NosP n=1 Tax=Thiopseudomonas alkaliphila TaxID=1697053 RepID=UPI00069EED70|nr:nitric oxide-sensing protein NosP [Thiopseudomonas alkaliphila]AKX46383.1 GfdT protein [Thiopseudomonas alkaliphila]AKX49454.1 GfdT protein [Thiopseudomonas alkaliphila]AKX52637.1 GfdT protein [Thiopseudomonas alkaliphila]